MTAVTNTPKDLVSSLWAAVAVRDWEAVGDLLAEDCIYLALARSANWLIGSHGLPVLSPKFPG